MDIDSWGGQVKKLRVTEKPLADVGDNHNLQGRVIPDDQLLARRGYKAAADVIQVFSLVPRYLVGLGIFHCTAASNRAHTVIFVAGWPAARMHKSIRSDVPREFFKILKGTANSPKPHKAVNNSSRRCVRTNTASGDPFEGDSIELAFSVIYVHSSFEPIGAWGQPQTVSRIVEQFHKLFWTRPDVSVIVSPDSKSDQPLSKSLTASFKVSGCNGSLAVKIIRIDEKSIVLHLYRSVFNLLDFCRGVKG
jgi:hypothetical protein